MKRTLSALIILMCIASQALALSDKDYSEMMKDPNFAQADKNLNDAWNAAKESLSPSEFAKLKKDQAQWIKKGRDDEVKNLRSINAGKNLTLTEAYASITDDRAGYIRGLIPSDPDRDIYGELEASIKKLAPTLTKGKPTFTDGDSRIWKGDKYVIVEAGKYLAEFFTADESMTFAEGIKVGMSESDLLKIFGGSIRKDDLDSYSAGGIHQWTVFMTENGKIKSIHLTQSDTDTTQKTMDKFTEYITPLQE